MPPSLPLQSFCALTAAVLTAVSVPIWRAWCLRAGLVDDPGARKIHQQPVPLAGGLAVLSGWLVGLAVVNAALLSGVFGRELAGRWHAVQALQAGPLRVIVLGAAGMLFIGWWDDRRELRPAAKFLGQLVVAFLVAAAGVRITLFVPSLVFSYLVTVLWILTVTNAMNFLDNMNGLCGGLGVIALFVLGMAAAQADQLLPALLAWLACGSLLGFLPFNFPRASAFLGDAGSHFVGYLVAVLSILPTFYSARHPHAWAVLKPLLILGVPLADLAWVVLLRWRSGKPFYVGDTNHLSHRLVRRGLTPVQAVGLIWLVAAALGAMTFLF